jgi:hypothetical protein
MYSYVLPKTVSQVLVMVAPVALVVAPVMAPGEEDEVVLAAQGAVAVAVAAVLAPVPCHTSHPLDCTGPCR